MAATTALATGSFTGTGNGTAVALSPGGANLAIWGTFVGTVVAEKSFDSGSTWIAASYPAISTAISLTAPAAITVEEPERGVQWRVRCSAYTSGTINYRISQ